MRDRAESRADLARCDRDGIPWPAAARRLLADLPEILDRLDELETPATAPAADPPPHFTATAALRWLVDLHDGPRDVLYDLGKPKAWDYARRVLSAPRTEDVLAAAISDLTARMKRGGATAGQIIGQLRGEISRLTVENNQLRTRLAEQANPEPEDAPEPLFEDVPLPMPAGQPKHPMGGCTPTGGYCPHT